MMTNNNLNEAKRSKYDEFYTTREMVESELQHYWPQLAGKRVYCNCDDPWRSEFVKYLDDNFHAIGLDRLMASHYVGDPTLWNEQRWARCLMVAPTWWHESTLTGNGDFRSPECVELLKDSDVVITNPPFSLFTKLFELILFHQKSYLLVAPIHAVAYKVVWLEILAGRCRLGTQRITGGKGFDTPDGERSVATLWLTDLDHGVPRSGVDLTAEYNPDIHRTYDNFDAINVDRTPDIPGDWDGLIGVPITFLDKWDPEQFELVDRAMELYVDGRRMFSRLIVRRRY